MKGNEEISRVHVCPHRAGGGGGGGGVSIAPSWCRWHLTLLKRENILDYN